MENLINSSSFSKICRICCNKRFDDLISLLDAENKTIVKKLRACADITFEHDDLLPKYICEKCLSKLNSAYNFKIQCEYMDQKLRESFAITIQKQTKLPLNVKSNVADNLEDSSFSDEDDSSFDFSSGQVTMDDVETIIEECVEDGQTMEEVVYLENILVNDPIVNNNEEQPKTDTDPNIMEISQKIAEMEKFDSQGSLPSAKEPEDQDMFSIKSDASSPKIKEPYKCDTCSEIFHNHSEYTKHTKTHGKHRFQCLVCNRWFAQRYLLNAHTKTHSGAKNFECSTCQKRFTTKTNLDRHIRVIHHLQKSHKCTTCQKTFSQLSTLKLHQSVHMAAREFVCDICSSKFKTEVHLKLHKKRHLPMEYRPLRKKYSPKRIYKPPQNACVCNECGKRFKSIALMRSHMKSHAMDKKYECNFCKKRFSFHQSLRNHIFLHTGEKRFKCDICDISFRQIGHLQGHKLVHSGVKPHTCSVCGKGFALRGNLTVHLRTHNGTAPHQCQICPKKFNDTNGLRRHQLVHERKNQTSQTIQINQINPTIGQILEAPIIEAPNNEVINEPNFGNMLAFNVHPETIQFIPPSEIVTDPSQFIFNIQ